MVGFSDVTPIHQFANDQLNWKSLHGVVASLNQNIAKLSQTKVSINDQEPIPNIGKIWKYGISYDDLLPLNSLAKIGSNGIMSGGNLTLFLSYFSTIYQPSFSEGLDFQKECFWYWIEFSSAYQSVVLFFLSCRSRVRWKWLCNHESPMLY